MSQQAYPNQRIRSLLRAENMRSADEYTIKTLGIPGKILMENAGLACVRSLVSKHPYLDRIAVVCGNGNNGGDGYVIARHLAIRGLEVHVFHNKKPSGSDARYHFDLLSKLNISIGKFEDFCASDGYDTVVDALFGTGLTRELDQELIRVVEEMNQAPFVLSVDIPSGVQADTGEILGSAVMADLTVSFEAAKPAHFLGMGHFHRGCLHVVPIGIEIPDQLERLSLLQPDDFFWSPRPDESYKGSFGHVFVLGGKLGTLGAALFASQSALRSGTGLVSLVAPFQSLSAAQSYAPEIMAQPLEDFKCSNLPDHSVLLLGPGAGDSPDFLRNLHDALQSDFPLVLDAKALRLLAEKPAFQKALKERKAPSVLTPHPGEFKALLNKNEENLDLLQRVQSVARRLKSCLVYKAAQMILVDPDGEVKILCQPNSALAKAGSGDVLAGLCSSALAQGMEESNALEQACLLHSGSGMLARHHSGPAAVTPAKLMEEIPRILSTNSDWQGKWTTLATESLLLT